MKFPINYFYFSASMLAIDRWIAMAAWEWYESGSIFTIIVLLTQEFILSLWSGSMAVMVIFGLSKE